MTDLDSNWTGNENCVGYMTRNFGKSGVVVGQVAGGSKNGGTMSVMIAKQGDIKIKITSNHLANVRPTSPLLSVPFVSLSLWLPHVLWLTS